MILPKEYMHSKEDTLDPQIQVTLVARSSNHSRKPRLGPLTPISQSNPLRRIIAPINSKRTTQLNPKTFQRNTLVVIAAPYASQQ
jgi:hypothetical protein